MFIPLNGPGTQGALAVNTTAIEVKVGGLKLDQRTMVTLQPLDGDIYFGYTNAVTTSTGTLIKKGQYFPLEATDQLEIWVIATAGPIDVRITEVG